MEGSSSRGGGGGGGGGGLTASLPPSSVSVMAASVGVVLTDDMASALSDLVMKKLRSITALAVQFASKEGSPGLRTSDFHKAEEVLLQDVSLGHSSSTLPPLSFRPAITTAAAATARGGLSFLDTGFEADLRSDPRRRSYNEIRAQEWDAEFNVHELTPSPQIRRRDEKTKKKPPPPPKTTTTTTTKTKTTTTTSSSSKATLQAHHHHHKSKKSS